MTNSATIASPVAVIVLFASVAMGCGSTTESHPAAGPAERPAGSETATPEFNGTYALTYDDGLERTWTVTECGRGCAVVEQTPNPFAVEARARSSGGEWSMEFSTPDAVVCEDNSEHPGTNLWSWDLAKSRGVYHVRQDVDACGYPAGDVFDESWFTITKSPVL